MCSAGCQNELSSIGQRTARELMDGEHGVEIFRPGCVCLRGYLSIDRFQVGSEK